MTTANQNSRPPPAPDAPPSGEALPGEGDILAGKYRIERVLGQGGMGVVVAAQHITLRQQVAVKFLLPEAAQREDATERFLREARAAVSIQSEHVARVMDVGTLENGAPYMVMELLTGADLGEVLRRRGPLPVTEAVDYLLQACEAIAEAHALGIIHRDLKPANLFLAARAHGSPLIKVLDFGLSKVTKNTLDASLTSANVVMGSPFYMSPEQIRSLKGLDARSDIWALGVILYQLLTGEKPFEAPSVAGLFFSIGADPPIPPRERRPELPAELEAAILGCLQKAPDDRTQSVAELARALAPFGSDDARISVERIHRVLGDTTPLARRSSAGDSTAQSAAVVDPDLAATLAMPPRLSASPPAEAVSADKIKSGSMAALTKDDAHPTRPPPAAEMAKARGGTVPVIVAAAVLAAAGVGFVGMRVRAITAHDVTVTKVATSSSAAPALSAVLPLPQVVTTASAPEPPASAAPPTSASAPAVVPSASASAAKPTKTPAKKGNPG